MRFALSSAAFFVASLGMLPVVAEDTAIAIDTGFNGQFFIADKTGTQLRPVVLVKRVDEEYVYYVKREFDCETHQVRYLGEGESLGAVAASEPDPPSGMEQIRPGSIADQIAGYVCPGPDPGPETEAGAQAEPQAPGQ